MGEKVKKGKKNSSKFIFLMLIFILIVVGIIFLGKYLKNLEERRAFLKTIHPDVELNSKETSYYNLLVKAMNDHEELVKGTEHIYFDVYDLPKLEYDQKENIVKKMLYTYEISKDKELLIDSFDGLYFRGILNKETSELKDGIHITFKDLDKDSDSKDKKFAISIYKSSDLNPTLTYEVKLDDDGKIVSYTKVSDLMPHENVETKDKENN